MHHTAQVEGGEADIADAQLLRGYVPCQSFMLWRVRCIQKRTRVEGRVQDGAVESKLECFGVS